MESHIREQFDRQDINEVLINVCRAYDRCDHDLMRSAYWPEATDDSGGSEMNAMEWVDHALVRIKDLYRVSVHTCSNVHVELDGEAAWVESYLVAHELHNSNAHSASIQIDGIVDCTGCIRFLDRFEKRDGEWRIARRKAILEMNRYVPASARWDVTYTQSRSARYPDDPWYELTAHRNSLSVSG